MPVSVFIQTLNEEVNLPRCLESVKWSDDVVVVDSLSTDHTREIAQLAGARVFQRGYDGRANNQNWAVENIEFKYPWVYQADADETVSEELAREIEQVTSCTGRKEVAYWVRFKNLVHGRWIKRSGMYPIWVPRLWRPERIRWQRDANPIALIDGPFGYLKEHFLHHTLSKGFGEWFEKHNKISTYEAKAMMKELRDGRIDWAGVISRDPVRRRQALKRVSFRMPCRPLLAFVYMYLLKGGFLDGGPGLTYCTLRVHLEYEISCKLKELRMQQKDLQT